MTSGRQAPAGLWRRLAAMFYDGLLLFALYMLTTALLLPFTSGEAITPQDSPAFIRAVLQLMLAGVSVLYFGICWTRTGQTLGMLSWKIRVIRTDGARLRWTDVIVRLAAALLSWAAAGLGFFWILIDRLQRAWHDRLSGTCVIRTG